jgi:hypothetical protein
MDFGAWFVEFLVRERLAALRAEAARDALARAARAAAAPAAPAEPTRRGIVAAAAPSQAWSSPGPRAS